MRVGLNTGISALPTVTDAFTYSGLGGRLSLEATTVTGTGSPGEVDQSWIYNALGQVGQYAHPRVLNGVCPSNCPLIESTTYTAGLPTAIYANGLPAVSGVTYAASGAPETYTTGFFPGETVTATVAPDGSGMPRPGSISTTGSVELALGAYTYDGVGNVTTWGSDTFGYDAESRLTSATVSGVGTSYSYDRFGNLLVKAGTPLCTTTCQNNRLPSPWVYDGRGNLTHSSSPVETYNYDVLDRTTSVSSGYGYGYDGAGERVVKYPPAGSPTYTYREPGSKVATEYSGTLPSVDNIFLGNALVASYANGGVGGSTRTWSFYVTDHLGTPRYLTDVSGALFETRKNGPWGEEQTTEGTSQRIRYASMEKDTEAGAGNDRYFDHARQHGATLGRFLSPDNVGGHVADPQGWNRYSYARANPLTLVDRNGLYFVAASASDRAYFARAFAAISQDSKGRALLKTLSADARPITLSRGLVTNQQGAEAFGANGASPDITSGLIRVNSGKLESAPSEELGPRDSSGTATTAHELLHIFALFTLGPINGPPASVALDWQKGDPPRDPGAGVLFGAGVTFFPDSPMQGMSEQQAQQMILTPNDPPRPQPCPADCPSVPCLLPQQ